MNSLLDSTPDPLKLDPDKDYLTELVGEDKKFKDAVALARGKAESDLYIHNLERQLDELRSDYQRDREQYTTGAKLQELLDQIKTQQLTSSETPDANEVKTAELDPAQIESLVSSKIQEYENSKRQQENYDRVRVKLEEKYGTNYQNAFKQQVQSLGLDETFVNDLARNHPQVFFKTFGLDAPNQGESFNTPPRSSEQRRDPFAPRTDKRDWNYYQEMRKKNPTQYYNPQTQVQLHKDAIALGEAFGIPPKT